MSGAASTESINTPAETLVQRLVQPEACAEVSRRGGSSVEEHILTCSPLKTLALAQLPLHITWQCRLRCLLQREVMGQPTKPHGGSSQIVFSPLTFS